MQEEQEQKQAQRLRPPLGWARTKAAGKVLCIKDKIKFNASLAVCKDWARRGGGRGGSRENSSALNALSMCLCPAGYCLVPCPFELVFGSPRLLK